MKQTHMVAKKEWDVLFVLDTCGGDHNTFEAAMDKAGILGDVTPVFNRFAEPYRGIWFERNFLQFQDGRHSDVVFIGADPLLWSPKNLPSLSAFGEAVSSWDGRLIDKKAQAIKDATKAAKSSPDKKLVVHLPGGPENLSKIASFAEKYDGLVAITTILEANPPWVWVDAVVVPVVRAKPAKTKAATVSWTTPKEIDVYTLPESEKDLFGVTTTGGDMGDAVKISTTGGDMGDAVEISTTDKGEDDGGGRYR